MTLGVIEEFKQYAEFSVRVDQFFYMINTYAVHHESLKEASSHRPSNEVLQDTIEKEIKSEEVKKYLFFAISTLDSLKRTGILSSADELGTGAIDPVTIPPDATNFAFYTCFCFQWSLFENFIKSMMQKLIDAQVISSDIQKKLKGNWFRTKQFFDLINAGDVFGYSPFKSLLPLITRDSNAQEINYSDLDQIRELRNKFIHGIESPEILPSPSSAKRMYYERSMWVLRQFATNVQFDVQKLLSK
jgi:hypothetical protein